MPPWTDQGTQHLLQRPDQNGREKSRPTQQGKHADIDNGHTQLLVQGQEQNHRGQDHHPQPNPDSTGSDASLSSGCPGTQSLHRGDPAGPPDRPQGSQHRDNHPHTDRQEQTLKWHLEGHHLYVGIGCQNIAKRMGQAQPKDHAQRRAQGSYQQGFGKEQTKDAAPRRPQSAQQPQLAGAFQHRHGKGIVDEKGSHK